MFVACRLWQAMLKCSVLTKMNAFTVGRAIVALTIRNNTFVTCSSRVHHILKCPVLIKIKLVYIRLCNRRVNCQQYTFIPCSSHVGHEFVTCGPWQADAALGSGEWISHRYWYQARQTSTWCNTQPQAQLGCQDSPLQRWPQQLSSSSSNNNRQAMLWFFHHAIMLSCTQLQQHRSHVSTKQALSGDMERFWT